VNTWERHLRPELAELSVYDVPPADARFARLHANECPVPWPPYAMARIAEVIRGVELGRYPDTSGRTVRAALGSRHDCDPERIVLGNGSDEVISTLAAALSGSRAPVVIPTPTFVMYRHSARVLGLDVREVPLLDDFELDEAAMHQALDSAALCFLARPNNPTGTLWDAEVIARLIDEHPSTVFVVDEAYTAYAPGASLYRPEGPSNQVHMATLSKVGGAAIRLGYCIAPPTLALALNKIRHPYNISSTSLAIAELILGELDDVRQELLQVALAQRDRLRLLLQKIPGTHVFPSQSNLVLARLEEPGAATRLTDHLARRHHVLIKDVSRTPRLGGCVRVSLGTPEELDRLEAGIEAFLAGT